MGGILFHNEEVHDCIFDSICARPNIRLVENSGEKNVKRNDENKHTSGSVVEQCKYSLQYGCLVFEAICKAKIKYALQNVALQVWDEQCIILPWISKREKGSKEETAEF